MERPYENHQGYSGLALFTTALIAGVIGVIIGYWFISEATIEELRQTTNYNNIGNSEARDQSQSESGVAQDNGSATDREANTAPDASSDVAFTIVVATLPEGQQTALRTMGFDQAEIVVSQATVDCAQASISSSRFAEIKAGSAPSAAESIAIATCYAKEQ